MKHKDKQLTKCAGNTLLHRVALLGNYEALSSLCKRAPDIVNRLNNILSLFPNFLFFLRNTTIIDLKYRVGCQHCIMPVILIV